MRHILLGLLALFVFAFVQPPTVSAQSCTCRSTYSSCVVTNNGCGSLTPRCTSDLSQCNDSPSSCECITITPIPTLGEGNIDVQGSCEEGQVDTAIGCVEVETTNSFAGFILGWGLNIAGGLALLLIGYSGINMATAGGNPKKVQASRELFGAAVAGLLFILFSVFILRLIGVELLGIPGFGG